ncbi:MAG: dCMP deaminase family protein [Nanoarchaeota archaeon]|nr:dCMP deaminase family protein [Nanoarchaeota archaeon]
MIQRTSWNEYFLKIALLVSERSTCLRRKVGAIAVKNKRILVTAYNGAVSGAKDCLELDSCLRDELNIPSGKDKHMCRAVHSEQNIIIHAAVNGINIKDAIIYATHTPCIMCARMLVNAKIKKYVTCSARKENDFEQFFNEAGIEMVYIPRPSSKIDAMDYRGNERKFDE